jgi:hypothetical protein
MLSTIAVAGALAVSPAYGHDRSTGSQLPDDRTAMPYGEALTHPDAQALEVCCPADQIAQDDEVIEGRVAAVEHESGRFVVDTGRRLVGLTALPEELALIDVGDYVRVSFVTGENDATN